MRLPMLLSFIMFLGCGNGEGARACTPGAARACECAGGHDGTQACNGDGSGYEICTCESEGPDAGPSPECAIIAGEWQGELAMDPSSTDPDCAASLGTVRERLTTLDNFVASSACPPSCSCTSTTSMLPDCTARSMATCSNGASIGQSISRSTETSANLSFTSVSAAGLTCRLDAALTRIGD